MSDSARRRMILLTSQQYARLLHNREIPHEALSCSTASGQSGKPLPRRPRRKKSKVTPQSARRTCKLAAKTCQKLASTGISSHRKHGKVKPFKVKKSLGGKVRRSSNKKKNKKKKKNQNAISPPKPPESRTGGFVYNFTSGANGDERGRKRKSSSALSRSFLKKMKISPPSPRHHHITVGRGKAERKRKLPQSFPPNGGPSKRIRQHQVDMVVPQARFTLKRKRDAEGEEDISPQAKRLLASFSESGGPSAVSTPKTLPRTPPSRTSAHLSPMPSSIKKKLYEDALTSLDDFVI